MKQFTFLQEESNRILSKSKNPSGLVLMLDSTDPAYWGWGFMGFYHLLLYLIWGEQVD